MGLRDLTRPRYAGGGEGGGSHGLQGGCLGLVIPLRGERREGGAHGP